MHSYYFGCLLPAICIHGKSNINLARHAIFFVARRKRREKMKQEQEEHLLHISVSNQSLHQTTADIMICLDGEQIFQREMTTGTQHTWEETTISVVSGQHTVDISETRTKVREERVVNVDRELWIVVTFHSPPARIGVEIQYRLVGFM